MKNNSLDSIKQVIEEIRASQYPGIPAELLEKIVEVHINNSDEESQASNSISIEKLMTEYLNKIS